MVFKAREWFP